MLLVALFLVAVVLLLLATFVHFKFQPRRLLLSKIPSPKKRFLLHNVGDFYQVNSETIIKELESWKKKLGPVFHFTLHPFHAGIFFVSDPHVAEQILQNIQDPVKPSAYKVLKGWLGEGLFSSTGERWLKHHKVIASVFVPSMMKNLVATMNKYDDKFVDILMTKGDSLDITTLVTNLSLDIIFDAATGCSIHALENPRSSYVEAVEKMMAIVFERTFNPLKMFDATYRLTSTFQEEQKMLKTLNSLTSEVIQARKNALSSLGTAALSNKSLLDTLLQPDQNFTDQAITDEINSFVHGGHDTTASLLQFLLFVLAKHEDVQEKVRNEALDFVFHDGNFKKQLSINDLSSVAYLDAVVKETLRLYPSIPFYGRLLMEDLTTDTFVFPKGAEVMISAYSIGRDPKVYENPLKFNPNRFIENQQECKFAFIPFSGGKRPCIGKKFALLTVKALILKLVVNFKIELVNKDEVMEAVMGIALTPKTPINIKFNKRKPLTSVST